MLGEKIAELTAKVTNRRVITERAGKPQLEISFEGTGKLMGVDVTEIGTYVGAMTEQGVLEGKGNGISTTKDGEIVTWTARGIGKPTGKGQAVQWRGSIFYRTSSAKLVRLTQGCFLFEHDLDETGVASVSRIFEWK